MPVYNGENYLRETLDNLLAQTYLNWEAICVDDSSTDNSFYILQEYAQNDSRFIVFQKKNERIAAKGVVYGLKYATGDYFMYSSQDDLFSPDLFEKSISRSLETDADFVLPVMKWYFGKNDIRDGYAGVNGDIKTVLSGREALLLSLDWRINGTGLIKMELIRKIGWYDYGYDSDDYTARVLFLNSNRVVFSSGIFYYRQNNPNAITQKFSSIQFESLQTSIKLEKLLLDNGFSKDDILFMNSITYNKLIYYIKLFFRNKKVLDKNERKKTRAILKKSWIKIDKNFLSKEDKKRLVNKYFIICYIYYYFQELKRSNRVLIKFLKLFKTKGKTNDN